MKLDIHKYEGRLKATIKNIEVNKKLSARNKKIIFKFKDYCVADGLTPGRVSRLMGTLKFVCLILEKDLEKANKEDIQRVVSVILQKKYSVWTKQLYKVVLKKFYKWLRKTDEYPKEVKWITTNIKRSEVTLPAEGDLLTEEEVIQLIESAEHPRDKALISSLYESGCRVGELLSMHISNVVFDQYGTVITVSGKTGSRKIRLVSSTPYLASWIKSHPLGEKNDPLWICVGTRNHNNFMHYSNVRILLKRLFVKVGLKKRFNPHIFRHSRATYLANHLTEFQMNQYFGWVQGSGMPSTYVHMSGKNVDNAILKLNGVADEKKRESEESKLKPIKCPRCDTINSHDSKFCSKCACVIDLKTMMEMDEKVKKEVKIKSFGDKLLNMLMKDEGFQKVLVQKAGEIGIGEELMEGLKGFNFS